MGGHNDGDLSVRSGGSELVALRYFDKGAVASDTCYLTPLDEVYVQNPGDNAWAGSVEYSSDGGVSFHSMYCTAGCNSVGPTSKIVVDGNADSSKQAPYYKLEEGTCCCPEGDLIKTQAECQLALESF